VRISKTKRWMQRALCNTPVNNGSTALRGGLSWLLYSDALQNLLHIQIQKKIEQPFNFQTVLLSKDVCRFNQLPPQLLYFFNKTEFEDFVSLIVAKKFVLHFMFISSKNEIIIIIYLAQVSRRYSYLSKVTLYAKSIIYCLEDIV